MILSRTTVKKIVAAAALVSTLSLMLLFQTGSQAMISSVEDGAGLFKAKCAVCHGADGSGNTAVGKSLKIRNLRSAEVQGQTDEQLLGIISSGKGKMPAYGKTLGADSCKALVAYVRTLKQ